VAKDISALKKTYGGDILVYGSATLVKALLNHNLVDEMHLMLHPISIGGGLKIFDDNRLSKKFTLTYSQIIDNGVLILEYQPAS
jgi:dihydrofolate reductase